MFKNMETRKKFARAAKFAMLSVVVASRLSPLAVLAEQLPDATAPVAGDPAPESDGRRSTGEMTITGTGVQRSTLPPFMWGVPPISVNDWNVIGDDFAHDSVDGRYFDTWWPQWDEAANGGLGGWTSSTPVTADMPGINVWARVIGAEDITYSVDIAWGSMKFVYDFGGADGWNPGTLDYDSGNTSSGTASWLIDNSTEIGAEATVGYLRRLAGETIGNNEIRVTNRSNAAVSVGMFMDLNTTTVFNDSASDRYRVAPGFYASEEDAQEAALVSASFGGFMGGPHPTLNALQSSGFSLPSAVGFALADNGGEVHEDLIGSRFFAFSGVPDRTRGVDLESFTNVGRITVEIWPSNFVLTP